ASTVGLPRESRTSRPLMSTIFAMLANTPVKGAWASASSGLDSGELLDQVIQLLELGEEGFQLVQAQRAGTVALGVVRIRMRFQEQAGQTLGQTGLGQVGDLATATAGGIGATTRHLQRVGDVEEHRVLELLHDAEAEHVHDQVVVAEAGAAFAEN